jgi:uncharacterized cupredoxin-like copper-binding protein
MIQVKHITAITAIVLGTSAFAHGDGDHPKVERKFDASKVEATPFGQQGDPKRVTRTIRVGMSDAMRFDPAQIRVKAGETIRFLVKNNGAAFHEMVLGTAENLAKHAELMKKFPGMEHDDPNIAHVKPGETGELIWQFKQAGEFHFACLVPGHYEAGMVGKVVVR